MEESPLARFRNYIATARFGRLFAFFAILIVIAAIPLTVMVSKQRQDTRQRASSTIATRVTRLIYNKDGSYAEYQCNLNSGAGLGANLEPSDPTQCTQIRSLNIGTGLQYTSEWIANYQGTNYLMRLIYNKDGSYAEYRCPLNPNAALGARMEPTRDCAQIRTLNIGTGLQYTSEFIANYQGTNYLMRLIYNKDGSYAEYRCPLNPQDPKGANMEPSRDCTQIRSLNIGTALQYTSEFIADSASVSLPNPTCTLTVNKTTLQANEQLTATVNFGRAATGSEHLALIWGDGIQNIPQTQTQGSYTHTFSAPGQYYVEAGFYDEHNQPICSNSLSERQKTINVQIAPTSIPTNAPTPTPVKTAPSDLIITDFHLTDVNGIEKTIFRPGENIYPFVTIKNNSASSTKSSETDGFFYISIYGNQASAVNPATPSDVGVWVREPASITPNETKTYSSLNNNLLWKNDPNSPNTDHWTMPSAGTFTGRVFVDSWNVVPETNETNNQATTVYSTESLSGTPTPTNPPTQKNPVRLFFGHGDPCLTPLAPDAILNYSVGQQDTLLLCLDTGGNDVKEFDVTADLTNAISKVTITAANEGSDASNYDQLIDKSLVAGKMRLAKRKTTGTVSAGRPLVIASVSFNTSQNGTGNFGISAATIKSSTGQTLQTSSFPILGYTIDTQVSPTAAPTSTPAPTDTPVPSATRLAFTLTLQGLGSSGNPIPLHPQRTLSVEVFDATNTRVLFTNGSIDYTGADGIFAGSVSGLLPTGSYTVKVKTDRYLKKLIPGIISIVSEQINNMPFPITLIAGDINGDNKLDILDYNILHDCGALSASKSLPMSDPQSLFNSAACQAHVERANADLDDNNIIDLTDFNAFARSYSVQQGD